MSMRRAFLIGSAIGVLVFLQALLVFRLPIRIHVIELWALAWGGVFGLTLGSIFHSPTEMAATVTFAAVGLLIFYGTAGVVLTFAYRRLKTPGLVLALSLLIVVHVGLYLAVVRSVAA
jgi:hypothetical protein